MNRTGLVGKCGDISPSPLMAAPPQEMGGGGGRLLSSTEKPALLPSILMVLGDVRFYQVRFIPLTMPLAEDHVHHGITVSVPPENRPLHPLSFIP